MTATRHAPTTALHVLEAELHKAAARVREQSEREWPIGMRAQLTYPESNVTTLVEVTGRSHTGTEIIVRAAHWRFPQPVHHSRLTPVVH